MFGDSRETESTLWLSDLLPGLSAGCERNGSQLLLQHISGEGCLPSRFADERIDGVLLHGIITNRELLTQLIGMPTVWLMEDRMNVEWGDQILPDWAEVGRMAASQLLSRGHRLLAFMNLDTDHEAFFACRQAFQSTAIAGGGEVVRIERSTQTSGGMFDGALLKSVHEIVEDFCAQPTQLTGLFIPQASQLAMIYPQLQKAGVPMKGNRAEVVSCHSGDTYLCGPAPRLLQIDIRAEAIGRRAIDQLMWRLQHPDDPDRCRIAVAPKLVTLPS
jgi:DNA-binding LacI/PurR family transcriptional regulator